MLPRNVLSGTWRRFLNPNFKCMTNGCDPELGLHSRVRFAYADLEFPNSPVDLCPTSRYQIMLVSIVRRKRPAALWHICQGPGVWLVSGEISRSNLRFGIKMVGAGRSNWATQVKISGYVPMECLVNLYEGSEDQIIVASETQDTGVWIVRVLLEVSSMSNSMFSGSIKYPTYNWRLQFLPPKRICQTRKTGEPRK
jgi:hypothetical protein